MLWRKTRQLLNQAIMVSAEQRLMGNHNQRAGRPLRHGGFDHRPKGSKEVII